MGLWDPVCHREPHGDRLICEPMLGELHAARRLNRMHKAAMANSVRWVSARRSRPGAADLHGVGRTVARLSIIPPSACRLAEKMMLKLNLRDQVEERAARKASSAA